MVIVPARDGATVAINPSSVLFCKEVSSSPQDMVMVEAIGELMNYVSDVQTLADSR